MTKLLIICINRTRVGFAVYGVLKAMMGFRLTKEEEYQGVDLSIHQIGANPELDMRGSL